MNALYAKFGLQGLAFATLPDTNRYQLFKQKEKGLITLDIQKELALLASNPSSKLCITVPTIGFTDPLLDYSPVPRFAFPISINGLVADEDDHRSAKAFVYGTDLAGNHYPLLRDQRNRIDYDAIVQSQQNKAVIYSTLSAITYVFERDQLIDGKLTKIAHPELQSMMEFWLCYPTKTPLTFTLIVKDHHDIEMLNRKICYYPKQPAVPQASFHADGSISCEAKVSDPYDYYRASWICDVKFTDTTLRLTHHAGLSYPFMRALLQHLMPQAHFFTMFSQKNHRRSVINDYENNVELQSIFYHHLIDSIINQSLPLMAMQDFFICDAHNEDKLKAISERFDEQDKMVFKRSQRLPTLDAFVDALDELIALRDPLFAAALQLPIDFNIEHVESMHVSLALEDIDGQWRRISGLSQSAIQEEVSHLPLLTKSNQYRGLRRK